MKNLIILAIVFLFTVSSLAFAGEQVYVDGYYKKDGTYVQPHYRSAPNSSRADNYSYPGNYNPNSGAITPGSNSPRELYPSNPNPYDNSQDSTRRRKSSSPW